MSRRLAVALALLLGASRLPAQQPDTLRGVAVLRLRADTLRIVTPDAFLGAGRLAPRLGAAALAAGWADSVRWRLEARQERRWRAALTGDSASLAVPSRAGALAEAALPYETPPPEAETPTTQGVLARYAELGIQLNALFDMRFEQLKNLHCTAADAQRLGSPCGGSLNPPTITPQFGVRTGGVVGQRVHLNVDYDTQREFDASNNIQVYYQGLEDEILRRVEVGNVTFSPPPSRFITGGIPANNFGVAARAQLGAMDFGVIYAQQKGNVVRSRVFTVGDQTVQPVDRFAADRDFEPQRFFFVRNPRSFPGYPAIDILNLSEATLPDSIRITQLRIYRHRSAINRPTAETNLSGLQAVALRTDSPQRAGPVTWEVLVEGRDYYLDPSGLWFALASRIDEQDFLAVSYVAANGDTTGTFPAEGAAGRVDTLELIYAPRTGPDVPTFFYEMRNVYRVGSAADVVRQSVQVRPVIGGSERPASGAPTFLALLGLAQSSDLTTFDEYNRLFPRGRDPAGGDPLRDYFVVFPHLTPFADSVALPPQYRTDSLYRTPTYLLRTQGPSPLYQIGLRYDAKGGDTRGTLQLGGYQIRQGSERVTVGGRQLTRDVDYTVNYEVGTVTFNNPDDLFRQPQQVAVQFEENAAFATAPTQILGLQGRYDLGDHGSINAVSLWQKQRTTFTRPPLGFEPASNLVMGVTGNFRFEPLRLTRLLDALPLVQTEAPSQITLDAEVASSHPSPNQVGTAYLETFESEAGQFIPLGENTWEYGSRPSSAHAVDTAQGGIYLQPGLGFQDDDAVAMTWQNLIAGGNGGVVQLLPQQIDPSIVTQGTAQTAETVLWMTIQPDTLGPILDPVTGAPRWFLPHVQSPRWRSITEPLSSTGMDLSRVEYLEFWLLEDDKNAFRNARAALVFDLGTVHEDAVDFWPAQLATPAPGDTVYSGRVRAGEGRLDTERDTLTATFNAVTDDNGILGDVADSILNTTSGQMEHHVPLCESQQREQLHVYYWGSFQAHCTRHNGQVDTEDLDNDQHLDTLILAQPESHLRYVVPVGDPRYVVRDGGTVAGAGTWRLYRIPFRADSAQVGTPDIRQIKALRLTVVLPATAGVESTMSFALARMRLVGAPWVKRASTPIAGLSGQQGQPHGEVVASIVTTENETDLGYTPPPGVVDQGAAVSGGVQFGTTQINEKSLRLVALDVRPGEHAEAFFRFPEGDRNFLGYRQMRLWARGRGAGWENRELSFLVKVGQDQDNFYLYRTPAHSTTWEPEVVVDFDVWFQLRAQIEQRFLSGQPPSGAAQCGGDTLAYVACSGPYVVHIRNPLVAPPNLTRVQELAVGLVRDSGLATDTAELWVDDIRLSRVEDTPGMAGAVNLNIVAADIATITAGASRRDGNFRQLGENPSYTATNALFAGATIRLERLGLERLGLTAPFTIRTDRTSEDPYFLSGTDIIASGLQGLRRPEQHQTTYGIQLRRARRGTEWWQKALVDNVGFGGVWSSGSSTTELSQSSARTSDLRFDYQVAPRSVGVRLLPGFLRDALGALPGFLRDGEAIRSLRDGRLRLSPANVFVSSGLTRTEADRTAYRVPIATSVDTALTALSSTSSFHTTAGLDLRPSGAMSLGFNGAWDRDLKDYGDSTTIGAIAGASREQLLGMDIGFLRTRSLAAQFMWAPVLTAWLRPRLQWNSTFSLSRDPNAQEPERAEGDTAGAYRLPTAFGNSAVTDLTVPVDVSRAVHQLFADSTLGRRLLDRITQLDFALRRETRSQYNRPGFDPGLGYQLGFGGIDAFRVQDGVLATQATRAALDRMTTSLRLPFSLSLTGGYAWRATDAWMLRGERQQLQRQTDRDWPNLQGRWLWNPGGGLRKVLTTLNASLSYTQRTSVSEFPSLDTLGSGLRFQSVASSKPATLSFTWAPGLTTAFTYSDEESRGERSGSLTVGDRRNVGADVRFTFRPPQDILPLRSDVRTALRWSYAKNATCVQTASLNECLRIADSRRSEYNLTMDTDMPPSANAGLSVGYVLTDDRHVNRKLAQFTLAISVRVFFNAGELQ